MKTNKAGIALIKKWEGCKLKAYKCQAGVWTVGYGHTDNVKSDTKITKAQAEEFLIKDLNYFENGVGYLIANALSENEFSALVSLAYNIGLRNLGQSSVLKCIKRGDRLGAANAILKWNKITHPVTKQLEFNQGLANRRIAEKDLFLL